MSFAPTIRYPWQNKACKPYMLALKYNFSVCNRRKKMGTIARTKIETKDASTWHATTGTICAKLYTKLNSVSLLKKNQLNMSLILFSIKRLYLTRKRILLLDSIAKTHEVEEKTEHTCNSRKPLNFSTCWFTRGLSWRITFTGSPTGRNTENLSRKFVPVPLTSRRKKFFIADLKNVPQNMQADAKNAKQLQAQTQTKVFWKRKTFVSSLKSKKIKVKLLDTITKTYNIKRKLRKKVFEKNNFFLFLKTYTCQYTYEENCVGTNYTTWRIKASTGTNAPTSWFVFLKYLYLCQQKFVKAQLNVSSETCNYKIQMQVGTLYFKFLMLSTIKHFSSTLSIENPYIPHKNLIRKSLQSKKLAANYLIYKSYIWNTWLKTVMNPVYLKLDNIHMFSSASTWCQEPKKWTHKKTGHVRGTNRVQVPVGQFATKKVGTKTSHAKITIYKWLFKIKENYFFSSIPLLNILHKYNANFLTKFFLLLDSSRRKNASNLLALWDHNENNLRRKKEFVPESLRGSLYLSQYILYDLQTALRACQQTKKNSRSSTNINMLPLQALNSTLNIGSNNHGSVAENGSNINGPLLQANHFLKLQLGSCYIKRYTNATIFACIPTSWNKNSKKYISNVNASKLEIDVHFQIPKWQTEYNYYKKLLMQIEKKQQLPKWEETSTYAGVRIGTNDTKKENSSDNTGTNVQAQTKKIYNYINWLQTQTHFGQGTSPTGNCSECLAKNFQVLPIKKQTNGTKMLSSKHIKRTTYKISKSAEKKQVQANKCTHSNLYAADARKNASSEKKKKTKIKQKNENKTKRKMPIGLLVPRYIIKNLTKKMELEMYKLESEKQNQEKEAIRSSSRLNKQKRYKHSTGIIKYIDKYTNKFNAYSNSGTKIKEMQRGTLTEAACGSYIGNLLNLFQTNCGDLSMIARTQSKNKNLKTKIQKIEEKKAQANVGAVYNLYAPLYIKKREGKHIGLYMQTPTIEIEKCLLMTWAYKKLLAFRSQRKKKFFSLSLKEKFSNQKRQDGSLKLFGHETKLYRHRNLVKNILNLNYSTRCENVGNRRKQNQEKEAEIVPTGTGTKASISNASRRWMYDYVQTNRIKEHETDIILKYCFCKSDNAFLFIKNLSKYIISYVKKHKASKNKVQQVKKIAYQMLLSIYTKNKQKFEGIGLGFSGRIYGAKKAISFKMLFGSVPLSTLSAKIDYAQITQKTINGTWGFRSWLHIKKRHVRKNVLKTFFFRS